MSIFLSNQAKGIHQPWWFMPPQSTRATKHEGKRPVERGRKGKKERRPVGKWKEGKVGTESWQEGKLDGFNTLVARGPVNIVCRLLVYYDDK